MSVAMLVIYEVTPEDPDAFYEYYTKNHLAIVRTFPKIKGIAVDKGVEGDIFMITRLIWDNMEDLQEGISSPERDKAKADMANFPAFEGNVRRAFVELNDFPL